jgi:hypothetical protein
MGPPLSRPCAERVTDAATAADDRRLGARARHHHASAARARCALDLKLLRLNRGTLVDLERIAGQADARGTYVAVTIDDQEFSVSAAPHAA